MNVSIIGTGYVGLVTGVCLSEIGNKVTCHDIDDKKIESLKKAKSPIYEPGLEDLLKRNIRGGRLFFSNKFDELRSADCIFLAVGTPAKNDGSANLDYLFNAAEIVAKNLKEQSVVVIKSTVPVGTSEKIKAMISKHTSKKFFLVSNPEFLKEGSAIEDFMRPDRVIIGAADEFAFKYMDHLYFPLLKQGNPIIKMSNISAELSKYTANCFLATKISFINEIAKLCDLIGADINEVRDGISSDKRIGRHFLYPGPGYGGSCFPKDVQALLFSAKEKGMNLKIVEATEEVNKRQKLYVLEKVKAFYNHQLKTKVFCLWGVSFKANTDDVRESAALYVTKELIEKGAFVHFYDPEGGENFIRLLKEMQVEISRVIQFANKYQALEAAHALIVLTEWREFSSPDYSLIKKNLIDGVIFDFRNLFDDSEVYDSGLDYFCVGKQSRRLAKVTFYENKDSDRATMLDS